MKYKDFQALIEAEAVLGSEYNRRRANNLQQAEAAQAAQDAIAAYREGRYTGVSLVRDPETQKIH